MLSCAPVGKDDIPDYRLFANPVVVRKMHGLQSEPDFGVDVQGLAEAGQECEEYRQVVEYLRSGQDWKQSPLSHPMTTKKAAWEELGVEDTAKGAGSEAGEAQTPGCLT